MNTPDTGLLSHGELLSLEEGSVSSGGGGGGDGPSLKEVYRTLTPSPHVTRPRYVDIRVTFM